MIDTSALVASLVDDHAHYGIARPHLTASTSIPSIVLAETFAQLRRTFRQSAPAASALLQPWTSDEDRILTTTANLVRDVFDRAVELDLGGNIHDALVAATCREHALPLVTLDRRQHTIALALGVESTLLLPSA